MIKKNQKEKVHEIQSNLLYKIHNRTEYDNHLELGDNLSCHFALDTKGRKYDCMVGYNFGTYPTSFQLQSHEHL